MDSFCLHSPLAASAKLGLLASLGRPAVAGDEEEDVSQAAFPGEASAAAGGAAVVSSGAALAVVLVSDLFLLRCCPKSSSSNSMKRFLADLGGNLIVSKISF